MSGNDRVVQSISRMPSLFAVLFLAIRTVVVVQGHMFCEDNCIIPFEGMSCIDVATTYTFDGDCCSLSTNLSTNHCMLTIRAGKSCSYFLPLDNDDRKDEECTEVPSNFPMAPPDYQRYIGEQALPDVVYDYLFFLNNNNTRLPPEFNMSGAKAEIRQGNKIVLDGNIILDMLIQAVESINDTEVTEAMINITTILNDTLAEAIMNITEMTNNSGNTMINNGTFAANTTHFASNNTYTNMTTQGSSILGTLLENNDIAMGSIVDTESSLLLERWQSNFDLLRNATCLKVPVRGGGGGKLYVRISPPSSADNNTATDNDCPASEVEVRPIPFSRNSNNNNYFNNSVNGEEEEEDSEAREAEFSSSLASDDDDDEDAERKRMDSAIMITSPSAAAALTFFNHKHVSTILIVCIALSTCIMSFII